MLDEFLNDRLYVVFSKKDVSRLEEFNAYIGGLTFPSGEDATGEFMRHQLLNGSKEHIALCSENGHIYYSLTAYKEHKNVYLDDFLPEMINVSFSEEDYQSMFERE